MNKNWLVKGVRDGIPIALGYFAVSFSLGIAARNAGLTAFQAMLASFTNNASAGEFACKVVSEPSCPVFMACSMSSASPPRHSPTMMRSGRMRRALITRSRIVTSPVPSALRGLASRRTT